MTVHDLQIADLNRQILEVAFEATRLRLVLRQIAESGHGLNGLETPEEELGYWIGRVMRARKLAREALEIKP